jgi:organic radical activating enzyme
MRFKEKQIISIERTGSISTIDWTLGNYCNYSCSYCFPGCHDGTDPVPKLNSTMLSNVQHLINQLRLADKKNIAFSFSGGEPTLYKDFIPLTQHIKSLGCCVGIVTNASRTLKWWQRGVEYLDDISISIHHEHADIDHICEVIDFLVQHRKNVVVHVMIHFDPRLFDVSLHTLARVRDLYEQTNTVKIMPKLLRDTHNQVTWYSQSQLDNVNRATQGVNTRRKRPSNINSRSYYVFEDATTQTIGRENSLNQQWLTGSWQGYSCAAAHEYIQIDYQGNLGVMSCGQAYATVQNIYTAEFEQFELPRVDVVCTQQGQCGCMGLARAAKRLTQKKHEVLAIANS